MTFSQGQLGNKLGNASCVQHHHRQLKVDFCSCQNNEKQGLVHKKKNSSHGFSTNINLRTLWEFDKDFESFSLLWKKMIVLCTCFYSYESSQSKIVYFSGAIVGNVYCTVEKENNFSRHMRPSKLNILRTESVKLKLLPGLYHWKAIFRKTKREEHQPKEVHRGRIY